jgi:hypothetical protein
MVRDLFQFVALGPFYAIDDLEHLTKPIKSLSYLELVTRVYHQCQLAEVVSLHLALH